MKKFFESNGWWISLILSSILGAFSINFSSIDKPNYILAGTIFFIGLIFSLILAVKHYIKAKSINLKEKLNNFKKGINNVLLAIFKWLKRFNIFGRLKTLEETTSLDKSLLDVCYESSTDNQKLLDDFEVRLEKLESIKKEPVKEIVKKKEKTPESIEDELLKEEINIIKRLGNMEYPGLEFTEFDKIMYEELVEVWRVNRSKKHLQDLEIIKYMYNNFNDAVGFSLSDIGCEIAYYYLDKKKKEDETEDKPPF